MPGLKKGKTHTQLPSFCRGGGGQLSVKAKMFKLEIKDEAEAEALISQNLTCHITGIIYKVEEFRSPVSVQQCWNCQSSDHSAKKYRSKTKCLICGESHHHKGCPNREKKQPKCANCKGPHVASYKGCPAYKNKHLDNMWWTIKSHMLPFYAKARLPLSPRIRHSHFQPNSL